VCATAAETALMIMMMVMGRCSHPYTRWLDQLCAEMGLISRQLVGRRLQSLDRVEGNCSFLDTCTRDSD